MGFIMKKLFTAFLFLLISVSVFAGEKYLIPEFEENEKAIVFDTRDIRGDYNDFLKVINYTDYCNISFEIYGMRSNKKQWYKIGTADLNGLFDEVRISSDYDHDYDMFRYFAVVPKDEDSYTIEMVNDYLYLGFVTHYYLVFQVKYGGEEPDNRYKDNASVIDTTKIRGSFEDNIKLVNNSFDRGIQVVVYGFDSEDEKVWKPIGTAFLKGSKDEDFVTTPLYHQRITQYRYYAVVSVDGTKYDTRAYKHHDDLYIELN